MASVVVTGSAAQLVQPDRAVIGLGLSVVARDAATVIHLVLVGGPDGGVYDVFSTPPSCTHQGGAAPSWANLYANPADSLGITAVQLRIQVDSGATRDFQLSVNVGNLPSGRSYVVDGRMVREDTPPSAVVERRGAGVVLRLRVRKLMAMVRLASLAFMVSLRLGCEIKRAGRHVLTGRPACIERVSRPKRRQPREAGSLRIGGRRRGELVL